MRKKFNPLGNLRRAERKIKRFSDTREWCGCVTPSEALALLDDGGRCTNSSMYQRPYLEGKQAEGDSSPSWFYFYPSRNQLRRWS